jgi:hypothetical protein
MRIADSSCKIVVSNDFASFAGVWRVFKILRDTPPPPSSAFLTVWKIQGSPKQIDEFLAEAGYNNAGDQLQHG